MSISRTIRSARLAIYRAQKIVIAQESSQDTEYDEEKARAEAEKYREQANRYRLPSKGEQDAYVERQKQETREKSNKAWRSFLENTRKPFEDAEKRNAKPNLAAATAVVTQFLQSLPPEQANAIRNNKYYGELVQLMDQRNPAYNYNAITSRAKFLFDLASSFGAKYLPKGAQDMYEASTNQRPGSATFDIPYPGGKVPAGAPDNFFIDTNQKTKTPQMGLSWNKTF